METIKQIKLPNGQTYNIIDTTYNVATQSSNGLLSKEDKKKLDGIQSGSKSPEVGNVTRGIYNNAGGVYPTSRAMYNTCRANRLAFLPAANIKIEKSYNKGKSWSDITSSIPRRAELFDMVRAYTLTVCDNNGQPDSNVYTRITISPLDRYSSVDTFFCWFCSNGNSNCVVDLEGSTVGEKDTFTPIRSNINIAGWSGSNEFTVPYRVFGGNSSQTTNGWSIRFTFKITGKLSTNPPTVTDIRMYGDNAWMYPNSMMYDDKIYKHDKDQNAVFPNCVKSNNTIIGKKIQLLEQKQLSSASTKFAVIDNNGYILYRTAAQIKSDIGASKVRVSGSTIVVE